MEVTFTATRGLAPKLDDLNKVYELLALNDDGIICPDAVADYFVLSPEQTEYYLGTAQYLNLINTDDGALYIITELGVYILSARIGERAYALANAVINSWILMDLIRIAEAVGSFTDEHIEAILQAGNREHPHQNDEESTKRSCQTIIAWIKWLAQEFGCFSISSDGYRLQ